MYEIARPRKPCPATEPQSSRQGSWRLVGPSSRNAIGHKLGPDLVALHAPLVFAGTPEHGLLAINRCYTDAGREHLYADLVQLS